MPDQYQFATENELVRIDADRLNARINELRLPAEAMAAILGMTPDELAAIRAGARPVTRGQVDRIAGAVNLSAPYLMGAAAPNVEPPKTAPPVVNPRDAMAVQAARKAGGLPEPAAPATDPPHAPVVASPTPSAPPPALAAADPVADLLEALEIEAARDPIDDAALAAKYNLDEGSIDLPGHLYRFGLRRGVPLVVLVAIQRIAELFPLDFRPRTPEQWATFHEAALPLARAAIVITEEVGHPFLGSFPQTREG